MVLLLKLLLQQLLLFEQQQAVDDPDVNDRRGGSRSRGTPRAADAVVVEQQFANFRRRRPLGDGETCRGGQAVGDLLGETKRRRGGGALDVGQVEAAWGAGGGGG